MVPTNASPHGSLEYWMGRWHPAIGDPSFMGWFTVGAYVACAVLAFFAARAHLPNDRRPFVFWSMVSMLMLVLAINKQLDLQTLLTEVGRQIARYQGWMEQRRVVQFWFIVLLSFLAIAGFLGSAFFLRIGFRRFTLAFIGLFFLLSFIIIRAASFHHVDEILHTRILHLKMNWILELSGISIVLTAAAVDLRRPHKVRSKQNLI
jgi:hypothetical protein